MMPRDFLFQLTQAEKADVVASCDHIQNPRFSKALPFAFTEQGAIQATNVSNVAWFADAFPVAAIVSTLSAKSSRRMDQLAGPFP
jgi:hypothetical protein